MNSLGLSISPSYHLKESFKIEPGNVPLIDVFGNNYRNNITSFKKKTLMHLEQLLYKGSISLIRWNELNKKFKGRKPNWWTDLKMKVIDEKQQLTLKFKDKIDINKIISSNKGILLYLNLNSRKKNWITGKIDMESKNLDGSITKEMIQIYGRLLTKKKQISTSNNIKIEHFCKTKTLSGKLALMKCQNQLCNYGTWENDMHCIYT